MSDNPAKKMDQNLFASLRRRYRTQKALRNPLNSLWDDIDYYTGPAMASGATATNPAGGTEANIQQRKNLWDFTAIDGREKFSSSIYGSTMGSAFRFFFLAHRDPDINEDQECAEWLSRESEGCWNDFQDSDFNVEMPAALHELIGLGNFIFAMEEVPGSYEPVPKQDKRGKTIGADIQESWEGVDFTAIPLRECYFEPDRKNGVKTFWRSVFWKPSQIIDFCEEKEIPVPEDIMDAQTKGSDASYEIVLCKFERPEILKRRKLRYPAAPTQRPYGCVWWREDNGEQLGEEGGYYERTVYKGLWSKTPGSKWGHGPGGVSLPTVKFVNGWKEMMRAAGEKAIDPSWMTTEMNLLSDLDARAGGVVIVRDVEKLKALESHAQFEVSEGMLEKDQKSIRDLYHVDELNMKDSPAMTATEAQIRFEWMNRLLGKNATSIYSVLSYIIMDLLSMRLRRGVARPMPKKMEDAGRLVNVEFQGPLARSQRADEVAAIERFVTFVTGMSQFYPEIRAAVDPVQAIKLVAQRLGVPANLIPPDAVLRKGMKQILDQMNQAQEADTQQKAADAEDKKASAVQKRNSTRGGSPGPLPGTAGPTAYPQLPPQPNLSPAGRVLGKMS